MDSRGSSPLHVEQVAKKAYSTPQVMDLGAIGQLSLGGSGLIMENAAMTNMMKRP